MKTIRTKTQFTCEECGELVFSHEFEPGYLTRDMSEKDILSDLSFSLECGPLKVAIAHECGKDNPVIEEMRRTLERATGAPASVDA